jgi:hypothetical protein
MFLQSKWNLGQIMARAHLNLNVTMKHDNKKQEHDA